jgi:hypothetical protein
MKVVLPPAKVRKVLISIKTEEVAGAAAAMVGVPPQAHRCGSASSAHISHHHWHWPLFLLPTSY